MTTAILASVFFYLTSFLSTMIATKISIGSFSGAPTKNGINSFIAYIKSTEPVTWWTTTNMGKEYAQGHSGEAIKAMCPMYEITDNKDILDRMIHFVVTFLSQRNDILQPQKVSARLERAPLRLYGQVIPRIQNQEAPNKVTLLDIWHTALGSSLRRKVCGRRE
jgi:hypothetical protein